MKQINKVINFLNANCINHQIYFTRGICNDEMSEVYNADGVRILLSETIGTSYIAKPSREVQILNELMLKLNGYNIPDEYKYYEIFGLSFADRDYIKSHLDEMGVLNQPIPLKAENVEYDVQ